MTAASTCSDVLTPYSDTVIPSDIDAAVVK